MSREEEEGLVVLISHVVDDESRHVTKYGMRCLRYCSAFFDDASCVDLFI